MNQQRDPITHSIQLFDWIAKETVGATSTMAKSGSEALRGWRTTAQNASADVGLLRTGLAISVAVNRTIEAENERLAAGQCLVPGGIVGDEGGTPYCTMKAENERLRAENASLTQLLKDIPPFEAECEAERSSRSMFVARLEKMRETGDQWLTIAAVLALLYDCDRLAAKASPEEALWQRRSEPDRDALAIARELNAVTYVGFVYEGLPGKEDAGLCKEAAGKLIEQHEKIERLREQRNLAIGHRLRDEPSADAKNLGVVGSRSRKGLR